MGSPRPHLRRDRGSLAGVRAVQFLPGAVLRGTVGQVVPSRRCSAAFVATWLVALERAVLTLCCAVACCVVAWQQVVLRCNRSSCVATGCLALGLQQRAALCRGLLRCNGAAGSHHTNLRCRRAQRQPARAQPSAAPAPPSSQRPGVRTRPPAQPALHEYSSAPSSFRPPTWREYSSIPLPPARPPISFHAPRVPHPHPPRMLRHPRRTPAAQCAPPPLPVPQTTQSRRAPPSDSGTPSTPSTPSVPWGTAAADA